ncbi:MAG: hypothetical protein HZA27_03605, partial [Candidatus Omnitrophica bacterium]|nr:hypothetical protein [Candidatus Omnitrophota bacterium]
MVKYYTGWCPWHKELIYSKPERKKDAFLSNALNLLKARKDQEALAGFEQILLAEPDNLLALW